MSEIPTSALALRDSLRVGDLSAVEVTDHFLSRIAAERELASFIEVTAEAARAEARSRDDAFASAADRSTLPALHGMPLAHKDLVEVTGAVTTWGSAALPHVPAEKDNPGVAVLRAAGSVSLGKTQVPEFGLNAYSENLIAAPARNPLDRERTPGGSSGGSAAAVASGQLPFAPGSDGGGSIRIPALACGLVGLKPGLGAIPTDVLEGERDAFGAPKLAVTGPIARDPLDAALLYDAMRGDAAESSLAAVRAAADVTGLHVGVSTESPFEQAHATPVSGEATAALESAMDLLAGHGHHVDWAEFGYERAPVRYYPEVFTSAWMAGLSLIELDAEAAERLTEFTREFRESALATSRADHEQAAADLREIAEGLRSAWGAYDVVLTPGLAFAPPRVGAFMELSPAEDYRLQCEWTPFTSMVNVSGLPAIGVPMQRLSSGLSVGVHLIGRPGSEQQLLQLAAQLMGKL